MKIIIILGEGVFEAIQGRRTKGNEMRSSRPRAHGREIPFVGPDLLVTSPYSNLK